jgi:hypothetical protein
MLSIQYKCRRIDLTTIRIWSDLRSIFHLKTLTACLVFLLACTQIFGSFEANIALSEELYTNKMTTEGIDMLEGALLATSDPIEQAIYLWHLARLQLDRAVFAMDEGASNTTLNPLFRAADSYAQQSIDTHPTSHGHFYKAATLAVLSGTQRNLGSLKLISSAHKHLESTISIDPTHADAWHTLGQLYLELPGWPISFGNIVNAASFARKATAVATRDPLPYDYYIGLARILWQRNWSSSKRMREITKLFGRFQSGKNEFDRSTYYEASLFPDFIPPYATMSVERMDDREEARLIANWLQEQYHASTQPTEKQQKDYKELMTMTAAW